MGMASSSALASKVEFDEATPEPKTNQVFVLPSILDLTNSTELREDLLWLLASSEDVRIDGQAVDRIVTPCIQLLLSAGHTLAQRGNRMIFLSPSDVLRDAFYDLGLKSLFDQWSMSK